MPIPIPSDPHLRRWMSFIDGENLTARAQKIAADRGMRLVEGDWYCRDVLLWFPRAKGRTNFFPEAPLPLQPQAVRAHYYTSSVGDGPKLDGIRETLWKLGFQPEVFKRDPDTKRSKGVDIALAKDFLCNAFNDNYDVAALFAGDGDYIPIVDEVKRMGKVVYVVGFEASGLNPRLRLHADEFYSLDEYFYSEWTTYAQSKAKNDADTEAPPGAA